MAAGAAISRATAVAFGRRHAASQKVKTTGSEIPVSSGFATPCFGKTATCSCMTGEPKGRKVAARSPSTAPSRYPFSPTFGYIAVGCFGVTARGLFSNVTFVMAGPSSAGFSVADAKAVRPSCRTGRLSANGRTTA